MKYTKAQLLAFKVRQAVGSMAIEGIDDEAIRSYNAESGCWSCIRRVSKETTGSTVPASFFNLLM